MLKRVLTLGLAVLLGNWIQAAALIAHGCHAAAPVRTAEAAAESTTTKASAHPAKDDHDCCPHPQLGTVASIVDDAEVMSCRGKSVDCCELERPAPSAVLLMPESSAAPPSILLVSMCRQGITGTGALSADVSDSLPNKTSRSQTTSLRL